MKPDKEDQTLWALWAADCAERVLPCFETQCPDDERPRNAVEAGRAWARGQISCGEARAAALAAHAADDLAACAAVRAAAHAAARHGRLTHEFMEGADYFGMNTGPGTVFMVMTSDEHDARRRQQIEMLMQQAAQERAKQSNIFLPGRGS